MYVHTMYICPELKIGLRVHRLCLHVDQGAQYTTSCTPISRWSAYTSFTICTSSATDTSRFGSVVHASLHTTLYATVHTGLYPYTSSYIHIAKSHLHVHPGTSTPISTSRPRPAFRSPSTHNYFPLLPASRSHAKYLARHRTCYVLDTPRGLLA